MIYYLLIETNRQICLRLHTCYVEKYSWFLKSNVCEVAIHSNSFIEMYMIGKDINSNLLSVFIDVNLYCQCDAINRIGRLNGRPYEFCDGMYPFFQISKLVACPTSYIMDDTMYAASIPVCKKQQHMKILLHWGNKDMLFVASLCYFIQSKWRWSWQINTCYIRYVALDARM